MRHWWEIRDFAGGFKYPFPGGFKYHIPRGVLMENQSNLQVATNSYDQVKDLTGLSQQEIDHIQRLLSSWGMLSDLSFADLLLFCPSKENNSTFLTLGQVRPTTNRTLHRSDLVGQLVDVTERSQVRQAWELGKIIDGEFVVRDGGEPGRIQCIPVRHEGNVIAILSRESPLGVGRKWGELERVYIELFERFAKMILEGTFPYPEDFPDSNYAPRVGDGLMVLDKWGRITYASPNAVNALHRVGVFGNAHGMRLDELVSETAGVLDSLLASRPVISEVERGQGITIVIRSIPLLEYGVPSGALALLRDVSDLKYRDRMLLSKEATIREIHHRVKNNLQTISSLLSLQARRMTISEGKAALREAERRIRSIAVVHEILAQEASDQVPFDEAVSSLVSMAYDSYTFQLPLSIDVSCEAGVIPADIATPLALVIAELLQNAVEHAFSSESGQDSAELSSRRSGQDSAELSSRRSGQGKTNKVRLEIDNNGDRLRVLVCDNGIGFPLDFSIEKTSSLGLSIVRDLVLTQLGGKFQIGSNELAGEKFRQTYQGAVVVFDIPLEN